ncbi:MAG: cohesin domain-containing protein [Acidobacteriota bacterium]|nr:cohesin domain-containing protein [Acidobacteriota bacterium]
MRVPMAATVLATTLLFGCEGGGGSPTAPAAPVMSTGIIFSPASPTDPAIALRGNASGSTVEIEVYAVGVDDLYGVSFELRFPADLLRYESHGPGVFPSLEATRAGVGQLLVGATHLGPVDGVSGGGAIVVARFTAIANGDGRFDFSGEEAFDSFGDRLTLNWHGGTVSIDL